MASIVSSSTCGRLASSHTALSSRPAARVVCRRQHRAQPIRALFGGGNKEGGGGNPFGNMGALMENVKKAQQLVQVEAAKVQEELAALTVEGYSSDETVRVTMSGNQEPKSVDITEEGYSQGQEVLSRLVTEAMQDAHSKSVQAMKTRMSGLASQLGLPSGMGM